MASVSRIALAVAYLRVSSTKQSVAGGGLESQLTRCRSYASQKGYELIGTFDDDMSGSLVKRPGMMKMLKFIRSKNSEVVVIVDDISRLARGLEAHIELRKLIAAAGGVLESPSVEFGDDPDSLMVERVLATMSEHHRLKNAAQVRHRMGARVENGYWPFAKPIGYVFHAVAGRGKMLQRAEPEATVIQRALEGFASGHYSTPADVQRYLQTEPSFPKGSDGLVTHQRVGAILRNPIYCGYVQAPNWNISLRKGLHDPLITFETHQKILAKLDGGTYAPRQTNVREDFPLRSYVVCSECGNPLTAYWARARSGHYAYYHCFQRSCPAYGKGIPRDRMHKEFEAILGPHDTQ